MVIINTEHLTVLDNRLEENIVLKVREVYTVLALRTSAASVLESCAI